jgi:hypothetical protein
MDGTDWLFHFSCIRMNIGPHSDLSPECEANKARETERHDAGIDAPAPEEGARGPGSGCGQTVESNGCVSVEWRRRNFCSPSTPRYYAP